MRLIQAKARCVEGVHDSGWFVPGGETTVIYDPEGKSISPLFSALQALNPPYDIREKKPFLSHPKVWQQGSYGRKVIPEKKTAVMMVYSAVPDLVRELAELDESLFETDRIEVGRRLDYSRWITFVEISASGRWSDVKEGFQQLRTLVKSREDQERCSFMDDLQGTDRLKGDLADNCRNWLNWLNNTISDLSDEESSVYENCLQRVNLAGRFDRARQHVEKWLPPTLAIGCNHFEGKSWSLQSEEQIGAAACLLKRANIDLLQGGAGLLFEARESLAGTTALLESEEQFRELTEKPQLVLGRDRFEVYWGESDSTLRSLQKYLYISCLLSLVTHGRKPLLLLDLTKWRGERNETGNLTKWIQALGKSCQVIVGTDSEAIAKENGWQAVLRVGAGGLGKGMLLKD
ncbi:hypothetical protein [Desulfosediminicola sp.]|uniref:hypothetical protein n=1 Tax=Desulfosediminicola sp. TaxID=2886825 RepID=UPI003AF2E6F2